MVAEIDSQLCESDKRLEERQSILLALSVFLQQTKGLHENSPIYKEARNLFTTTVNTIKSMDEEFFEPINPEESDVSCYDEFLEDLITNVYLKDYADHPFIKTYLSESTNLPR